MKVLFFILILPSIIYAQQTKWYDEIYLNGFVSMSYTYNFNNPASGKNQYRTFDFADNTFNLDVAELVFQKPVNNPGEGGFRLDLTAGTSIPRIATSTKDTGEFALQQIFISYIANIGNGIKIDAGKFVSPMGYEVIQGYDGYNDNASRSYLFGYAIPYTNTGIKISYPFSKRFNTMLYVTNGWDNSTDNNKSKSIGVQATYLPSDQVTVTGNFLGGPEQNDDNSRNRFVYDFSLQIKLNDRLSIGVNGDYGTEQKSDVNGNAAKWYGASGYIRYYLSDDFSFAFRGETFNDWSGTRTGTAQRLDEFTLTPEYKINKNIIVRGDLRYDESNLDVFEKENQFLSHQLTVSLNMLFIL